MVLDERGVEQQFGEFEDELYEDLDHEYLYDPKFDGIEDWFKPFRKTGTVVHPYCPG